MTPTLLILGLVTYSGNGPCLTGSRADTFLVQVRHVLSSSDSFSSGNRRVYGIAAVPRARVHLVTNERLCAAASVAYAKHAGPGADKKPPFAVAVAAADDLFVVELGETAGRDAPYWEVVIFDRKWRRIASYGGGS